MKHPGGRPLLFETREDLEKAINQYFKDCEEYREDVITKEGAVVSIKKSRRPTIAGLAYALDIDRQTLYNYEKREKFFDIIKKARNRVIANFEDGLANGEGSAGLIFLTKNYGYTDRTEVTHDIKGSLFKVLDGAFFDEFEEDNDE